jgi:hypothetical protein
MKVISFKKNILLISLLGVVFYVVPEYFLFKGKEYRLYNSSNDKFYEKLDYLEIASKFPGYKKEVSEIQYEIGYEFGVNFGMSYIDLRSTINNQVEQHVIDSLNKIYDSIFLKDESNLDLKQIILDEKDLIRINTTIANKNDYFIRPHYILDSHILLIESFLKEWDKPINNMPLEKGKESFIYYKVKNLLKN